jgi:hypothetical protein
VAAVREMTGLRETGAFGLLYDARNPYFAGAGDWPGWAAWLELSARAGTGVTIRALSWQQLIPLLPPRAGETSCAGRRTGTG